MSWVSFFVPPVGEIKSGSVQSVCVLSFSLVHHDKLGILLRAPGSWDQKWVHLICLCTFPPACLWWGAGSPSLCCRQVWSKVGPFSLSVYLPSAMFVMMSWVSFFVPPVGEIKIGSVQSVCVLFLACLCSGSWIFIFFSVPPVDQKWVRSICLCTFPPVVCDDELGLLLRTPIAEIKGGSVQFVFVLYLQLFMMISGVSFFVPPVGEIKSGSVQSACVLFLLLACDEELDLNLLLRAPGRWDQKGGSFQSVFVLFLWLLNLNLLLRRRSTN